ncbi:UDP-2,3-diacylglucosamine diphosphatase, partial [bacterium]
ENDLNITIYRKPIQIQLDGHSFYIAHGDGINKKDVGYHILKIILRSPITSVICRLMHPDLTFTIARWLSLLSRQHRPDFDNREPYINYAKKLFKDGYRFVVFGHTHVPMTFHLEDCTYINTGDWINQYTYAIFHNGKLELKKWTKLV